MILTPVQFIINWRVNVQYQNLNQKCLIYVFIAVASTENIEYTQS